MALSLIALAVAVALLGAWTLGLTRWTRTLHATVAARDTRLEAVLAELATASVELAESRSTLAGLDGAVSALRAQAGRQAQADLVAREVFGHRLETVQADLRAKFLVAITEAQTGDAMLRRLVEQQEAQHAARHTDLVAQVAQIHATATASRDALAALDTEREAQVEVLRTALQALSEQRSATATAVLATWPAAPLNRALLLGVGAGVSLYHEGV